MKGRDTASEHSTHGRCPPHPSGPSVTPPCQTCSQVGSELLTSLKGNVAPQATHCPLSEALPGGEGPRGEAGEPKWAGRATTPLGTEQQGLLLLTHRVTGAGLRRVHWCPHLIPDPRAPKPFALSSCQK